MSYSQKKNNDYLKTLQNGVIDDYTDGTDEEFITSNNNYLEEAIRLKDTLHIARSYWILGNYYDTRKQDYVNTFKTQSKAAKLFLSINDNYSAANMIYNNAAILRKHMDFTSAEINCFKALELVDKEDLVLQVKIHNLLGVIYKALDDTDEAINQYAIGLSLIENRQEKPYVQLKKSIYNNLAALYRKTKEYNLAFDYIAKSKDLIQPGSYKDSLRNVMSYNLIRIDSGDHAAEIETQLLSALKMSQEKENQSYISSFASSLANYYRETNQDSLAVKYLKTALDIDLKQNSFESILTSYKLLSNLEPENANKYFTKSNVLRDSLDKAERAIRNKFTRIQYETDQYKEQNELLTSTKNYLTIFLVLISIISGLGFYIFRQRSKQKQLSLLKEMEIDKAEMYKLSLESHEKYQKGKDEERKRISMELHDGVLSSLSSIKLSLGIVTRQLKQSDHENLIQYDYEKELSDLEKDIRRLSHELHEENANYSNIIALMTQNIISSGQLNVSFDEKNAIDWSNISAYIKSNLLRIIQEAHRNALKHAKATHFNVSFESKNTVLLIEIKDDGIGFDTSKKYKGIGLLNIKKRVVDFLKGTIKITSNNSGTSITITLNLEHENN